jgi:hypothetical protein
MNYNIRMTRIRNNTHTNHFVTYFLDSISFSNYTNSSVECVFLYNQIKLFFIYNDIICRRYGTIVKERKLLTTVEIRESGAKNYIDL